ncbi:type VII secretion-associated serine protease mycosin [Actinoplanes sp. NPDC026619]|uniref:type VII secretion-associated serine protease mycosin n=1 Tax=Actinoplanes sp. NPDC026619 TaxID=3155798 RepID=UPI0033E3021A
MRPLTSLTTSTIAAMIALLSSTGPAAAQEASTPQWSLDADHFDASRIWQLSTGKGVVVAVVDTGVDAHHPDLAGRILPGADFTGTAADGRVDTSSNGHGTSVAGIIAGNPGRADGVTGLAPGASIMPVRISIDLAADPAVLAQGIDYAATHGAKVINISSATPILNPQVRSAVDEAFRNDIVVVAAAGNDGQLGNPAEYPAALPGVIAVAATDNTNTRWPKSETGPYLGLSAPGVDIYTTSTQGSRITTTGTSFAAPQVAATAALLRARYPDENAAQIIARLTTTAHGGSTGRDAQQGYGLIDPFRALTAPEPAAAVTNPLLQPMAPVEKTSAAGQHRSPASSIIIGGVAAVVAAAMAAAFIIRRRNAARRPRKAA